MKREKFNLNQFHEMSHEEMQEVSGGSAGQLWRAVFWGIGVYVSQTPKGGLWVIH